MASSDLEPALVLARDIDRVSLSANLGSNEGFLTIQDIKRVRRACWEARLKWIDIGIELDLNKSDLEAIQQKYNGDVTSCFTEMLSQWLRQVPLPNWEALITALSRPAVGHQSLAMSLETMLACTGVHSSAMESEGLHSEDIKDSASAAFEVAHEGLSFPNIIDEAYDERTRKKLEQRLRIETENIMYKFFILRNKFLDSLEDRNFPISRLVRYLEDTECISQDPKNLVDVQRIIKANSSFFNYRLVEYLIELAGTDTDKKRFRSYEKDFLDYAQRRIYECSSTFGTTSAPTDTELLVKLDSNYDHYSVIKLQAFQDKLCVILGRKNYILRLLSIEKGCFKLVYAIPYHIQGTIFPLTTKQEADLTKLGVLQLICNEYHFLNKKNEEDHHNPHAEQASENFSNPLVLICRECNITELKSKLERMNRDEKQKLLNQKDDDGTTPLHESCCQGDNACTKLLLKNGADVIIWDVRGFAPIHCAAYNGHAETIEILLKWEPMERTHMRQCAVDEESKYKETALHIACFRGHFEVVQYLIQEKEASLLAVDSDKNTVLHYAASSNNGKLLVWLLGNDEVKTRVDAKNKFGQTAAHRAAILGCVMSISILVKSGANFGLEDNAGHTPLDLAKLLSHQECYDIAIQKKTPLELPHTPRLARAFFPSTDNLPVSIHPQGSISNSSAISASPQPLIIRRRGSMTSRSSLDFIPRRRSLPDQVSQISHDSFQVHRSDSNSTAGHWRSLSNRSSLIGLNWLQDQAETKSRLCEEMELKLLFASAYDPPPDLHFIPPLESDTLTKENNQLFSDFHYIFLRIPREHWETAKDQKVEVRACATMGLNQYPDNYVIVSPICFISCKSEDREVTIRLKLPHAASVQAPEYRNKICILSTMSTSSSRKNPNTPLFTPTDRKLMPLNTTSLDLEFDVGAVNFKLKLLHPALFAVAIIRGPIGVPRSIPIPLRCKLYVLYKVHDGTGSLGRIMVYAYVALRLQTVDTYMQDLATKEQQEIEERLFTLDCSSVQVSATLRNPVDAWEVTPLDDGLFNYHQVALSSDTPDQSTGSYRHDHPYPLRQRFFIEPKTHACGAIKCNVIVQNSDKTSTNQRLASVLVLPYAPTSKDTTPEPSRVHIAADINLPPSRPSTHPPSPCGSISQSLGGLKLRPIGPLSGSLQAMQNSNGAKSRHTDIDFPLKHQSTGASNPSTASHSLDLQLKHSDSLGGSPWRVTTIV